MRAKRKFSHSYTDHHARFPRPGVFFLGWWWWLLLVCLSLGLVECVPVPDFLSGFASVQIKTTKKIVLKLKCSDCGLTHQAPIKRCKRFELGGEKKVKKSSKAAY